MPGTRYPINREIGARICKLRHAYGLTRDELARQTGVSIANIQEGERGRSHISRALLETYAAFFHVPLQYLIDGKSEA